MSGSLLVQYREEIPWYNWMFLKIKISYWRTFSVYFSKESLPLAYISSIGLRRRLRPPSLTNLDTWSYPKLMTAPLLIPAPETPLIQSLRLSPDDSARLTQACICWVTPRCAGRIEHAKLSRQAGPKSSVLWGDLIFGRRIFGKGQHNIFSTPGRWIGPRFFLESNLQLSLVLTPYLATV